MPDIRASLSKLIIHLTNTTEVLSFLVYMSLVLTQLTLQITIAYPISQYVSMGPLLNDIIAFSLNTRTLVLFILLLSGVILTMLLSYRLTVFKGVIAFVLW